MFETPLFLIAAAVGAAVPLILHLLQHKRSVPVPFPTLRFLKLAEKSSSRRIRLENILLWLLRTAIMALLGLAFAMPVLRQRGWRFLGRAPRDLAIVLDASYSMSYQAGRHTVWEKAVEQATALIEGLESHDRYCLYLAREQPEALVAEPLADRDRGLGALRGARPLYGSSRLLPAMEAAYAALRRAPGRRERELHVLTDNQALPWRDAWQADGATDPEPAAESAERSAPQAWAGAGDDRQTAVFVSLLGVSAPENTTPLDVQVHPPLLFAGAAAEVTVTLGHNGPPRDIAVTLWLNEREIARRAVTVGGGGTETVTFGTPALPVGTHVGRVEVPDDPLMTDNAFHFLIRVRDQLPVLLAGLEHDIVFLRAALEAAAAGGGLEPRWVAPEGLAEEPLEQYATIFLCNALPLPGQTLTAIERYVAGGGLLVLFPGLRAVPDDYRAWTCLPAFPAAIHDVARIERTRTLTWDQPQHPALRSFRDALAVPRLALQRSLRWEPWHAETRLLVSAGAEQPFLLERPFGRGRVLMYAVSANRDWSTWPLSPYYLPLMMQTIEYGAGSGAQAPFVWGEEELALGTLLPAADRTTRLLNPANQPLPLSMTMVAGRPVLHARQATVPGIYHLEEPGGGPARPVLAVNFRREESDLTPLPEADLEAAIDAQPLAVARDRDELLRLLQDHRVGRSLGEHLLWLALLLMVVEFLYANWLLRNRPSLSHRLAIKVSGRVGGHIALHPSRGGAPS